MKKLVLALIVALTLAPFSAFGLEMMTDDSLKDVTAQAGVAIALDDIVIEQFIGKTMYIDSDGSSDILGAGGAAHSGYTGVVYADTVQGALIIGDRHRIQHFNAIYTLDGSVTVGDRNQFGVYTALTDNGGTPDMEFYANPLIIDIGTCHILTGGMPLSKAGVPVTIYGVTLRLPTLEIHTAADEYTISTAAVTQNATTGLSEVTAGTEKEIIRISKGASTMGILDGIVEIAPH
jgi:hypothetical protein